MSDLEYSQFKQGTDGFVRCRECGRDLDFVRDSGHGFGCRFGRPFRGMPTAVSAPEDAAVLRLCEQWGFGAVMSSAARQWRQRDPVGAKTVGPCVALLSETTPEAPR